MERKSEREIKRYYKVRDARQRKAERLNIFRKRMIRRQCVLREK